MDQVVLSKMRHLFLIATMLVLANSTNAQLFINEIVASNNDAILDPDFQGSGDWVEIYNAGGSAVSLDGHFVTDDFSTPNKWQISTTETIPAGGFQLIWMDGNATGIHTNFKLSASGEEVALYNADLVLQDSVSYGVQQTDHSWGRITDGGSEWGFFLDITPAVSNGAETPYDGFVEHAPLFSPVGSIFGSAQTITLTSNQGGTIRYTTDGTEPDENSTLYSGPITVSSTQSIRARVFESGKIPGPITTHSYLIDEELAEAGLPIICITSDPYNFYDPEDGIYVQDFKADWEVPINIELFENDGSDRAAFNLPAGTKLNGANAYKLPQKMLGIYFRSKYGAKSLDYPLFPDDDRASFKSFSLRVSGSDWSYTYMRDIIAQTASRDIGMDIMKFRPVIVYLNGEFLGLHNIREKVEADYCEENFGLEKGTFDMTENENYAEEGTLDAYYELLALTAKDMSVQANFDAVAEQMDVYNFCDYFIIETWDNNTSANHNLMTWKPRGESKWRWIMMDLDRGFFNPHTKFISFYMAIEIMPMKELINNPGYKTYFTRRFSDLLYTTLSGKNIGSLVDNHASKIDPVMPTQIDRWLGTTSSYGNALSSYNTWKNNVNALKTFANSRQTYLFNDLKNYYGISSTVQLDIANEPVDAGQITFNEIQLPMSDWTGQYPMNMEFEVIAKAKPGYEFVGWMNADNDALLTADSNYTTTLSAAANIKAVYQATDDCILASAIENNTTLNLACSPYLVPEDVTVAAGATLTIEPGVELLISEGVNILINGNLDAQGTDELPIQFKINPEDDGKAWGALSFVNTTGVNQLDHVIVEDASYGANINRDVAAISAFNAVLFLDHMTLLENYGSPVFGKYSAITMLNSNLHSDITGDLINVKYGFGHIENCVFTGNDQPDTDAIDYDDVTDGIIKNCVIENFQGFNSDAIDIGEEAVNVMIDSIIVYNITDKGVSVGQQSSAQVTNSVFINCGLGLGLKDSCHVTVDHCTFVENGSPVYVYEKNIGRAGGNLTITNSILSNSYGPTYFVDDKSVMTMEYCLSDNDSLPTASNNIWADPLFTAPNSHDYSLQEGSPAKEASNTQTDLGAVLTPLDWDESVMIAQIFIGGMDPTLEFVSLYNPTDHTVDLSGYQFTTGFDFVFPTGALLESQDTLIITSNENQPYWLSVPHQIYEWTSGKLDNNGETITLADNFGIVVDQVDYDLDADWPQALFLDHMAQLKDGSLDNHFGYNWTTIDIDAPLATKNNSINNSTFKAYPNPTANLIHLSGLQGGSEVICTNLLGDQLMVQSVGSNGTVTIDVSALDQGIVLIKSENQVRPISIVR